MTAKDIIKASVAHNEEKGKIRVFGGSAILSEEEYIAFNKNPDFIAGAEWMKEQIINKACEWLKLYRQDTYDGTGYVAGIINDKTIEDFRKAMEGEK